MMTLRVSYPSASCELRKGTLYWRGKVKPTPLSREYKVTLTYAETQAPKVWVSGEDLQKSMTKIFPTTMALIPRIIWFRFAYTVTVNSLRTSFWQIPLFHGLSSGFISTRYGWQLGNGVEEENIRANLNSTSLVRWYDTMSNKWGYYAGGSWL